MLTPSHTLISYMITVRDNNGQRHLHLSILATGPFWNSFVGKVHSAFCTPPPPPSLSLVFHSTIIHTNPQNKPNIIHPIHPFQTHTYTFSHIHPPTPSTHSHCPARPTLPNGHRYLIQHGRANKCLRCGFYAAASNSYGEHEAQALQLAGT